MPGFERFEEASRTPRIATIKQPRVGPHAPEGGLQLGWCWGRVWYGNNYEGKTPQKPVGDRAFWAKNTKNHEKSKFLRMHGETNARSLPTLSGYGDMYTHMWTGVKDDSTCAN